MARRPRSDMRDRAGAIHADFALLSLTDARFVVRSLKIALVLKEREHEQPSLTIPPETKVAPDAQKLDKTVPCVYCRGGGKIDPDGQGLTDCTDCNGSGRVAEPKAVVDHEALHREQADREQADYLAAQQKFEAAEFARHRFAQD